MQNKIFMDKLAANAMILLILFSFMVYLSTIFASTASTKFSGIVYASPGIPVNNAMVVAYGDNGTGFAVTNSLGQYNITEGIPTGTYTVEAIAEGYIVAKIENVAVVTGQETSNINFYLSASGGISGRVTDAVSGEPLQNIIVYAYLSSGSGEYGWYAFTDANGNYSIITNLGTGTYNVSILFAEGYIPESISGIDVTAGFEVKGVDFTLDRSGIISGRVTTTTGDPLGNATVYASSEDGNYFGYASTNATGHYRISSGLGTGNYTVIAYWDTSFGMFPGTVEVTAGAETSNVNIEIPVSPPPPSGIITGRVTDTRGNPIEGALVTAEGPAGYGTGTTDENGNYVISSGLGTGTYTVTASAPGYIDEQITGVSVTVGKVTSGIDFQLEPIPPEQSGRISGTVQGDENIIPEFQNPPAMLLAALVVVTVLAKILEIKAKRYQQLRNKAPITD
ncbi:MAG: carboxypeptidase-like regulatory domain-containing protein [Candidatus Bathyarchaeia archaeon]